MSDRDQLHCRRTPILSTTVSRHNRIHSPSQNRAKTKLHGPLWVGMLHMLSATAQNAHQCYNVLCLRILGQIDTKQLKSWYVLMHQTSTKFSILCFACFCDCHRQLKMICQGKLALRLCPKENGSAAPRIYATWSSGGRSPKSKHLHFFSTQSLCILQQVSVR